jgi:[acyl-carrier-protein] S-malonyltransferase
MLESGEQRPGTMAAILGDVAGGIEAVCAQASAEAGIVVPANYNSPGQVVISGEIAAVDRAMELAKAAGAKRAIRLNVSGAFHSPLMEVARGGLECALGDAPMRDPEFPVYANVTAEPVRTASDARRLLLEQLTAPVAWTRLVERLARDYPDALYVEMGPGNVLAGLVKKIAPSVQTATCGTAAEVEQLLSRVA